MRVMMNEEEFLKSKMGTRNPFVVPEGYFDQLTAQVMQKINAEEEKKAKKAKPTILRTLRPLLYAAACSCIALFGVATYQHLNQEASEAKDLQSNIVVTDYSDSYFEECADYAMLDNDDIYASLLADM
jgi:hypothetical protein